MKRLMLLLLVASLGVLHAQDVNGVLKTNPLGWFAGQYQFGYEHFISPQASVQLMPGAIYSSAVVSINDSIVGFFEDYSATRAGFIVLPEFRYYFAADAPDGLYIAGFGRYRSVKTTVDEDVESTRTKVSLGGGFVLGYQIRTGGGLIGEAFIGPQFKSVNSTYTGAYEQYDDLSIDEGEGTGVRFGVTIGFGL